MFAGCGVGISFRVVYASSSDCVFVGCFVICVGYWVDASVVW